MFRRLSPFLGLLFGVLLTVPMLLAGSTVLVNQKAAAADASCFVPVECVSDIGNSETCKTKGCCNGTRCFEPNTAACGKGNGFCYAKSQPIDLIIDIGGQKRVLDLGDYFAAIYTYAVGIAGVLATVLMMIGGFEYLTGRPAEGMKRIKQAFAGMGLTFAAFLVLQTVNPDLVLLRLPKIQVVKKNDSALCKYTDRYVPCGLQYGIKRGEDGKEPPRTALETASFYKGPFYSEDASAAEVMAKCTGVGCKVISAQCEGGGCAGSGCTDDAKFKCQPNRNDGSPETIKGCSANSFGSCFACASAGAACGPGMPACCGSCIDNGDGTGSVCQTGTLGDRCGPFNGCAEGYHCVQDPSFLKTLGQAVSTGTLGVCYAGGVGMPCGSTPDCRPGLECTDVFQNFTPKLCLTPAYAALFRPDASPAPPGPPPTSVKYIVDGGGPYALEYVAFNSGVGCKETDRAVPYLKTSSFRTFSTYLLSYFIDAEDYELGICTDGELGSVCIAGKTQCNDGLLCIKASVPGRSWSQFFTDTASSIGVSQSYISDFGVCATGREGSRCASASDCVTGYSCAEGNVCEPS